MATPAELVVRDGTGQSLIPARKLILTRAPQITALPTLQEEVATYTDITLDNHAAASACLKTIRTIRKQVEQHHDVQKTPLNDARARALDLEKQDVAAFKNLETALGARLIAFDQEVERQRRLEQARLQQEAIAKAQAEADARAKALRDAAKVEEDAAIRKQLQAQARAVKEAPVFVAPVEVAAPVTKTSTVTRWSADITDIEALVVAVAVGILRRRVPADQLGPVFLAQPDAPLAALEPERLIETHPWLNTQASQAREEFSLPGVVAVQKTSLSGR